VAKTISREINFKDLQMEQWKIISKEPKYRISDLGRVLNIETGSFKSVRYDKDGYPRVTLYPSGKTYTIHRLIMENFYEESEWDEHVNHIDSNRANSVLSNLEWVSASDNTQHMVKAGRNPDIRGTKNPSSRLSEEQIEEIRSTTSDIKDKELAINYRVSRAAIQRIRSGTAYQTSAGTTAIGRSKGLTGASNSKAKLTESQAFDIKYNLTYSKNSELALLYGVSIDAIRRIRSGKSWPHL